MRWRILMFTGKGRIKGNSNTNENLNLYNIATPLSGFCPKVSVIVPNFNHAVYLRARLDSIYSQTYANFEVILLDDFSNDNSVDILQEYAGRYPENTRICLNSRNSGSAFRQWRKGFDLASGELVWIAESDDACSENLLEELVSFFYNPGVMLAFARTEFIQGSNIIWSQEEYMADIDLEIWRSSFVKSAMDLIKSAWCAKNIVPNVSGAIFRNPRKMELLDDPEWLDLHMCGDWIFYLTVIRGGLVGYSTKATNYYRQHNRNTSVGRGMSERYYREHEIVGKRLVSLYPLQREEMELQERLLYIHWSLRQGDAKREKFNGLYSLDRIYRREMLARRKSNIAIAIYAFVGGGGETFPIMLANLLAQRGFPVTVFNFNGQMTEPKVREMLSPRIPVIEILDLNYTKDMLVDLAIELVHSHHAWVDVNLMNLLGTSSNIKHLVTLHGMYETLERDQLDELIPRLLEHVDAFVYVAAKNLSVFPKDIICEEKFTKIDNALPAMPITKISRSEFGLSEDDFVLCMVARAIPEKGWEETILSVIYANKHSRRNICLLMIGSGQEEERLKKKFRLPFIHFLGFRSNTRNYFAMSDAGILLTRFKGESAPLVLIDCLFAGKPMLASAIGDIPCMLGAGEDGLAGILFELDQWKINIEHVGEVIVQIANSQEMYSRLLENVPCAAKKFDTDVMMEKYEMIYAKLLSPSKQRF
jgi:glycosyltransferase involved in cell wall biosynthesis